MSAVTTAARRILKVDMTVSHRPFSLGRASFSSHVFRRVTGVPCEAVPRRAQKDADAYVQSDTICPFCIIGYRQLLSAIGQYNNSHPSTLIEPKVLMHPYRLMADLPEETQLKKDVMLKRFGPERVEKMGPVMKAKLAEVGVNVE